MNILFLSFTCEDIRIAMVTNMISQLQESFPLYYSLYFSFITLYPSLKTFLWQAFCHRWPLFCTFEDEYENEKKSCVLCRNFISIYKINRALHGRLGIRILSSCAKSISHEWAKLEDKIRIPARPCNILYIKFKFHRPTRISRGQ